VIPDFCSDRALNRCEDIFAVFVDDNCADKKDSFADAYDEYEAYCEGTIDDSGTQSWCRSNMRLRLCADKRLRPRTVANYFPETKSRQTWCQSCICLCMHARL
jgi:hypothetical protein